MSSFFGLFSTPSPKSFRWSDKIDLPGTYLTPAYYCYNETGKRVGRVCWDSIDFLYVAVTYMGNYDIKETLGSFETAEHAKAAVEKELLR